MIRKYLILLIFIFVNSFHFAGRNSVKPIELAEGGPLITINNWQPGNAILQIIAKSSGIKNPQQLQIISDKINFLIRALAGNEKNNAYISLSTFLEQSNKYFTHEFASFEYRDHTGIRGSVKENPEKRTAVPALLFKGIYSVIILMEDKREAKLPQGTLSVRINANKDNNQWNGNILMPSYLIIQNIYLQVRHDCNVNFEGVPSQYSEKILIGQISQIVIH